MKKKLTFKRFENPLELSKWIESTPVDPSWEGNERSTVISFRQTDFSKTESFDQADELLKFGWREGANKVLMTTQTTTQVTSIVTRHQLSPVGFMPLAGPALAGSPRNMLRRVSQRQPTRVVRILYNIAVGCTVEADDITEAAGRFFNAVKCLELAGVRVELWAGEFAAGEKKSQLGWAVKIKTASQPLNMLSMCYPVIHPSMLRRHGLAVTERLTENKNFEGYGSVITYRPTIDDMLSQAGLKDLNILDFYRIRGKDEDQIIKLLK